MRMRRTFASSVTKEEYKINHCFHCNEKCFSYFRTFKVCLKQYVEQTVDEFRLKWNNYKSNNRKQQRLESCIQENLFEHFNEEGHHGFLEDISITFIDKTDPSAPLKREKYWKSVLKIMAPLGLPKTCLLECIKGLFSENPLTVNVLTSPWNCWNLQKSTFILLSHHFEPAWVRKSYF